MATEVISRKDARAQGLKRYFTGQHCKRGHVAERHVSNLTCMECQREKSRARYPDRDRDAERERLRVWKKNNREKVRGEAREYNNRPEIKARQKAYYADNYEHIREGRLARYAEQRQGRIAYSKAWCEANPDKAREHSRMGMCVRRARKRGAGGTHTATDLAAILKVQGNRCAYCRTSLNGIAKHVDHIIPLKRGGSNARSNLQYLCRPCNQSKGAKHPVDYARSIGLLL